MLYLFSYKTGNFSAHLPKALGDLISLAGSVVHHCGRSTFSNYMTILSIFHTQLLGLGNKLLKSYKSHDQNGHHSHIC